VVVEIDGKSVTNADDAVKLSEAVKTMSSVMLRISRQGSRQSILITDRKDERIQMSNPERPQQTAASPPEQVRAFCEKLLADESSHDIERILTNYAPKADYEDYGTVDISVIRKDKVKYFERWPHTTNRIKGNAAIRESSNVWLASFTNEWTAENASEKRMGESEAALAIVGNNGVFKVIKEKTNVIKRANENGPIDLPKNGIGIPNGKYLGNPERNTGGAARSILLIIS